VESLETGLIVAAVQPQQLPALIAEIVCSLVADRHVLVSVVAGVSTEMLRDMLIDAARDLPREDAEGKQKRRAALSVARSVRVVRAMPNTAIAVGESMTCICGDDADAVRQVERLFECCGQVMVVTEDDMLAATALCACGIAFFCRAIRAASQGGVEVGFRAEDAMRLAAQTCLGAATLLCNGEHPESALDRVTTPKGCTITGLNQMEHNGFSSAFIKGITTSAQKASNLLTRHRLVEDSPARADKRRRRGASADSDSSEAEDEGEPANKRSRT
jgi:pyrroline-5-carboxylate reductase